MSKFPDNFNFIHRRKEIEFWHTTGEVIGTSKFSETHVSSSGGGGTIGGYVSPYGGHVGGTVSAPTVSSHIVTNHEFWIRTDEGKEVPIKLAGFDIPLRTGQRITIISAGRKGKDAGWYSCLVNHNADKYWYINNTKDLNKKLRLEKFRIFPFVIALLCLSIPYFILRNYNFSYNSILIPILQSIQIIGVGYLFYNIVLKSFSIPQVKKRLQKRLEELVQFSRQNLGSSQSFSADDALRAVGGALAQVRSTGAKQVTIEINE